jgi:hypothetical protein
MVPFGVQNSKHNYTVTLNTVKDFVGKPAEEQPTKTIIINRAAFGVLRKQANGVTELVQQLITQAGTLHFIP